MPTLYDRLAGVQDKIALDYYIAYAQEQIAGKVTRGELLDDLAITDAGQQADHDDIIAEMDPLLSPLRPVLTAEVMRNSMVLAEASFQYTTGALLKERWGIP